jgi:hypothetical protein
MQVTFSPAKLQANADQQVEIAASVRFSACAGSSKSQVNFAWAQASDSDGAKAPISPGFDLAGVTSSTLYIPPYALAASATYRLTLSVTLAGDSSSSTRVTYDFSVGVLPLVAQIAGGDVMAIGYDTALVLDGSGSVDPNVAPTADQALTYSWACILDDGVMSQMCLDQAGSLLAMGSGSKVTIPALTLSPSPSADMPYKFVLQVSKNGRCAPNRSTAVWLRQKRVHPRCILCSVAYTRAHAHTHTHTNTHKAVGHCSSSDAHAFVTQHDRGVGD